MHKFKRLIILQLIFLLIGCESKTRTCSSNIVIDSLTKSIEEKLIENSLIDYKKNDLLPLINIDSIQTTSIDEKLNSYYCNGNLTIKYPDKLVENIYKSYSTDKGRQDILQRLKVKYGDISGFLIHSQMIAILSISNINAIFNDILISPNQNSTSSNTLTKILNNASNKNIRLSYEVFPIQNNKSSNFKIEWDFDDLTDIATIELLLNISRVYEN